MTEWVANKEETEWQASYLGNQLMLRKGEISENGHQMWEWYLNGKRMQTYSSGPDAEWQQKQMMSNVKTQVTGWIE